MGVPWALPFPWLADRPGPGRGACLPACLQPFPIRRPNRKGVGAWGGGECQKSQITQLFLKAKDGRDVMGTWLGGFLECLSGTLSLTLQVAALSARLPLPPCKKQSKTKQKTTSPKASWSGQEFLNGCHRTQVLDLAGSTPCSESLVKSLVSVGPSWDHRRGCSPALELSAAE